MDRAFQKQTKNRSRAFSSNRTRKKVDNSQDEGNDCVYKLFQQVNIIWIVDSWAKSHNTSIIMLTMACCDTIDNRSTVNRAEKWLLVLAGLIVLLVFCHVTLSQLAMTVYFRHLRMRWFLVRIKIVWRK